MKKAMLILRLAVLMTMNGLLLFSTATMAGMVRNDAIGNDPDKEKLCVSRLKMHGQVVPFEIDSDYVVRARSLNPDTTFIAVDDGNAGQLVECYVNSGTGMYQPNVFTPENWFWHLIKPPQFKPGLNTQEGREKAANVCLAAAKEKINRPNFDHIAHWAVVEVTGSGSGEGPKYHAGILISGRKAERYDIAVEGRSFYNSSGPDLDAVNFKCLLSPMLDVKAIELNSAP